MPIQLTPNNKAGLSKEHIKAFESRSYVDQQLLQGINIFRILQDAPSSIDEFIESKGKELGKEYITDRGERKSFIIAPSTLFAALLVAGDMKNIQRLAKHFDPKSELKNLLIMVKDTKGKDIPNPLQPLNLIRHITNFESVQFIINNLGADLKFINNKNETVTLLSALLSNADSVQTAQDPTLKLSFINRMLGKGIDPNLSTINGMLGKGIDPNLSTENPLEIFLKAVLSDNPQTSFPIFGQIIEDSPELLVEYVNTIGNLIESGVKISPEIISSMKTLMDRLSGLKKYNLAPKNKDNESVRSAVKSAIKSLNPLIKKAITIQAATVELLDGTKNHSSGKIKSLIKKGANINAKDAEGRNILNIVILQPKLNTDLELIKFLIESGVDYKNKPNNNRNLPYFTYRFIHNDILIYKKGSAKTISDTQEILNLLENGLSIPKQRVSEEEMKEEVAKHMAKADILKLAEENWSQALILALETFNDEALEGLMMMKDEEFDWNAVNNEDDKKTALHLLVENGFGSNFIKSFLKEYPSNLNAQDKDGNTPLHIAAENGYNGVVKLLIGRGADVQMENNEKNSPDALTNNDVTRGVIQEAVEAAEPEAAPNIEEEGARSSVSGHPNIEEEGARSNLSLEDELKAIEAALALHKTAKEPSPDPHKPFTVSHLEEQNKTQGGGQEH